jgi:hypothetical protein
MIKTKGKVFYALFVCAVDMTTHSFAYANDKVDSKDNICYNDIRTIPGIYVSSGSFEDQRRSAFGLGISKSKGTQIIRYSIDKCHGDDCIISVINSHDRNVVKEFRFNRINQKFCRKFEYEGPGEFNNLPKSKSYTYVTDSIYNRNIGSGKYEMGMIKVSYIVNNGHISGSPIKELESSPNEGSYEVSTKTFSGVLGSSIEVKDSYYIDLSKVR